LVEGQSLSDVHPEVMVTHWWVAGLHASPTGQVSGEVRHPAQTPGGISQYGVLGVSAHSALDVHFVVGWPPSPASTEASGAGSWS
jgi:hypothetical protein